eukprot:GHRQ01029234.1.p1 GENE.GHRQ01029234.1~~GHRQ01029234.1.p1  ORF type:complete len:342 (+),score=107.46 GHRQ01029234.1:99-1028(+)
MLTAGSCWGLQQFASILGFHQQQQRLHTSVCSAASSSQPPPHYVQIGRLSPSPGSSKTAIRWGRGNGSDRGTYCGRGIKGQKARKGGKPHILFDGGQKQLKKYPKVWVTPSSPVLFRQVGLSKVLRWARLGLLDTQQVITMKDLRDSGCVAKTIRWGVELVAHGNERVDVPLHLQVSSASTAAQELLEAAGGSVTRVYYTRLGLTALLKVRGSGHCCCSSPARLRSSNLVKAQAHTAVTCRALLGREVRMLVTAAASGGLVAVCSLAYRSAATWLTSHAHRLCRAAATCNNMQAYCSTEHRASAEWPGA